MRYLTINAATTLAKVSVVFTSSKVGKSKLQTLVPIGRRLTTYAQTSDYQHAFELKLSTFKVSTLPILKVSNFEAVELSNFVSLKLSNFR